MATITDADAIRAAHLLRAFADGTYLDDDGSLRDVYELARRLRGAVGVPGRLLDVIGTRLYDGITLDICRDGSWEWHLPPTPRWALAREAGSSSSRRASDDGEIADRYFSLLRGYLAGLLAIVDGGRS